MGSSWEILGRTSGAFWKNFGKIFGGYLRFRDPRAASPTRLASTMRGGLVDPPTRQTFGIRSSHALGVERSSSKRASRIPSRTAGLAFFFALGGQVGAKLAPRSHFFAFFLNFFARCFEVAFFSVLGWFSNGFWEVWGWIWECSGKVFLCFFFPKNHIL